VGKLIVLEGLYSAGKSTQVGRLAAHLRAGGARVVVTEWNSSPVLADAVLAWRKRRLLVPRVMFLLEVADFADRLDREILPALREGAVVVADRYVSTAIARATVRGVDAGYCAAACAFAPEPDAVCYLRATPATTLARRLRTGRSIADYVSGSDYLTGGTVSGRFVRYQESLQRSYLRQLAGTAHVVDADGDEESTWHQLRPLVDELRLKEGAR
jgi:dTMP kinase